VYDERAIIFQEECEREMAQVQLEIEYECALIAGFSNEEHAFYFGPVVD